MPKLGRNKPCWCGSGKKYKQCHLNRDEVARRGSKKSTPNIEPRIIENLHAQKSAEESRRVSTQGKGRRIISTEFEGHRFVVAGNKLHYSPIEKTQTFADFLGNHIRTLLTPEWGNAEIAKPLEERHPVMQWYDDLCRLQKKHCKQGEVYETPSVGLVIAYNSLAYNLYLLAHNAEVLNHLLTRIKNKESFHAAYYETYVAAWFILAGFKLSLEDETDSSTTHCEFTAQAPSGQCYSVEAKSRASGKKNFAFGNQLYKALKKKADHPRIVCIEMNLTHDYVEDRETFENEIINRIRKKEDSLLINGEPAPPAYVFITNIPFHLHLNDDHVGRALLADGYKIHDFGYKKFSSITAGYKARLKHTDILSVARAFESYVIPSTFNDELPEFTFGDAERRFTIGESHKMDDGTIGVLKSGMVVETEKKAYLTYETEDGKQLIYTGPLSDTEISAYKRHPETFFGRVENTKKEAKTALDLFEFFYNSLKETPREKMLEWFATAPDFSELEKLSTEELAFLYAERHTISVIQRNPPPDIEFG